MKTKLIHYLLFAFVVFWTSCSFAGGIVSGNVEFVRTHNATALPSWSPPSFWFTLKGVANAGSCPKWNGKVLFVAKDAQALELVIAAIQSNQQIAVAFDDHKLINSYCSADYITIGNPAPLY